MRTKISCALLAIIALSVAFMSCDRNEEPNDRGTFGELPNILQATIPCVLLAAEASPETAKNVRDDGLVSLKPPYTDWKANKSDPEPKISLQYAVMALCRQAGKQYDFTASLKNTDPICRRWVTPDIDDKPWEEAMEELLAPFDITYITRGNVIVLISAEDLDKVDQVVQGVASDSAHSDSPDIQPPRLHDEKTGDAVKYNIMIGLFISLVNIFAPVTIILMCIPLMRGEIGMNGWYGIRLPKAFKSEENWYKINRYGAQKLILWCKVNIVVGIFALVFALVFPPVSEKVLILLISAGPIVFICTIPLIEILLYARKL